jgi:hypothetical protein
MGENGFSRRSVIKATSAGIAGVSSTSGLAYGSDRKAITVSDVKKSEIKSKVSSDREVRRLIGELDDGWNVAFAKGKYATVTVGEGDSYDVASIPLVHSRDTGSKGVLVWEEAESRQTFVALIDGVRLTENGNAATPDQLTETVFSAEMGNVKSNTNTLRDSVEQVKPLSSPVDPQDECREVVNDYCVDFNMSCIGIIIASLGLGCNPVIGGAVACVLGAGVGIAPFVTGDNCNICDEYSIEKVHVGEACESGEDDPCVNCAG